MEKLELKYVTPYLPYGLKVYNTAFEIVKELSISPIDGYYSVESVIEYIEFKLILKPLVRSMDNQNFLNLHSEWSRENFIISMFTELGRCGNWRHFITMEQLEWLLENHYDVFGLIDKGLAIDVNIILSNAN